MVHFLALALLLLSVTSIAVLSVGAPANTATNAPVVLSNTSDKTVFESSFQNFGFYAQGRYWVFYENTMFNCENMGGCLFFTSSLDGSSWATPVNVGIHVTDSDWSIVSDGTHAYYVRYAEKWFDSVCNLPLLLGTGILGSGGSITWQAEQTVRPSGAQDIFLNDIVKIDSNNQLWVGYQDIKAGQCGGSGDETPHVVHSVGLDYSSWTGDTVLSNSFSNNWDIDIAPMSGGQVYAAYWINTHDLHGRIYNGTAWGPDEQISYSTDSTDVNSFIFASGTSVYAIWNDANSQRLRFGSRSTTGQWTISNIGTGEAPSASSLAGSINGGRYSLPIAATFDPGQSTFYLYWFNTTGGHIDQWAGSGSSWTETPRVFTTASESGEYTIASYIKPSTTGGSAAIAVMWVDQPTSPYNLNFGLITTSQTSPSPLNASFTYNPNPARAGQPVSFAASASGGTPPYSFNWNFGDGTNGTGSTTTHTYASAGSYTVTLTASDSGSPVQSAVSRQTVQVIGQVQPLTASMTFSPSSPQTGQQVTFIGTASGGTAPYSFNWNFGDGSTGTGASTNHAYSTTGTYTVLLTVKDASSPQQTATSLKTITVTASSHTSLTSSFSYSPALPETGQQVTFTATASGGTGAYHFTWSLGDGSTGSGSTTSHSYNSPGTFTVTLTVTDSGSPQQTSTSQKTIALISPPPPLTSSFSYSPSSPQTGQQVAFSATASGGTGTYHVSWNFGDGSTGSGMTTSHTYTSSGTFTVTLTVADSGSPQQTSTSQKTITVTTPPPPPPPPLSVSLSVSSSNPIAGETVTFTGNAQGGVGPYSFSWDFGDGASASSKSVTHSYSSAGTYTATLTLSDSSGQIAHASQTIVVSPKTTPLSGDFSYSPSSPLPLVPVTFSAHASGGTGPYSYSWDFGDGSSGSGQSTSHSYLLPGTYTVTLTITDAAGQTFTTSQSITVLVSISIGL